MIYWPLYYMNIKMNSSIDTLRRNVINANGQHGEQWVNNLAETIQALQKNWSLENITPVPNMNWNFVALALQKNTPVVLKISAAPASIELEYQALSHFSGVGAVTIKAYSSQHHALLLEQLIPGISLKQDYPKNITDVIHIYADIVRKLSTHKNPAYPFEHVKVWCNVIDEINDSRVPLDYIETAKKLRSWIFATITDEYLCHGDLHLENIVHDRQQWLAIDPKGIIGEMAFEVAAFDLVSEDEKRSPRITGILRERIEKLAKSLNLDNNRLTAWIFLKAMISIQWLIEDKGDPTTMIDFAHNIILLI